MAAGFAKVETDDIVLGEPLPWDVFNRVGILLLKKGAIVQRQDQLDRLIDSGVYANEIELQESRLLKIDAAPIELPSAWLRILEVRKAIEGAVAASRAKSPDFLQRIANLVLLVDEAIEINTHVSIAAITMKTEGAYAQRHPVDCAVVVSLLGRAAGHDIALRHTLMSAALTMNISKFDTHDALNKIGGLLSADHKAGLQAHPAKSVAALLMAGVTDQTWLDAVAQHHERFDGEGYPDRLKGNEISEAAQLLALADWYCARLNPRADRTEQLPAAAVRLAQSEGKRAFSVSLPMLLSRALGNYPAGSFVKLTNGEISVVGKQTANPDAPIVYTVKSPRGPLHSAIKRETDLDAHTVREAINPALLRFDKPLKMVDLWGKDAEGG